MGDKGPRQDSLCSRCFTSPEPKRRVGKPLSLALRAADMFLGDDFHHNGAFRLSYGFEYATQRVYRTRKHASHVSLPLLVKVKG
jgi:hypothetical protein